MTRYGAQFGPNFTFLGVPECDLDDEASYANADVVILGAPFDGGTSNRAGTRFGPQAIRMKLGCGRSPDETEYRVTSSSG